MTDAIEVTISTLNAKGRGIAETSRGRVAVPFAIPGDIVQVEIIGKRKGIRIARAIETLQRSGDRVEPRCPYVGRCGGCPWQMIDYAAQLRYKRTLVQQALRDGGSNSHAAVHGNEPFAIDVPDVLPAVDLFYYRNRMDYVFGANGELGLKEPERWWSTLDLSTCLMLSRDAVEIMMRVRAWAREYHVIPWDPRRHTGFARYLVIREGKRTGERMVMLVTAPGELPGRDALVAALQPLATSILWGINPRITDLSTADTIRVLHGQAMLHEELHIPAQREGTRPQPTAPRSLTFAIPPNSFFQTNTAMAERLVVTVRELAALSPTDLLVDLYCGVGVFSIALAPDAERVIGVEADPEAIAIAKQNASANGTTNVQFILAKSEAWSFPIDPIDCLIVDPPRSGLHPRVIQKILALRPHRIIYVSCSPTALARDLTLLLTHYAADAIRCLDLFPHTPHVETVVRLQRHAA